MHTKRKRILAMFLSMTLMIAINGPVDVAKADATTINYDLSTGALVLDSGNSDYTITGSYSATGPAITVRSGFTGSVTLDGVSIAPTSGQGIQLNAPIVVTLAGVNTVTGVMADAIAVNSQITVQGSGSLTCTGGNGTDAANYMSQAGTGESGFDVSAGSALIIKSGTISAYGGTGGSGMMSGGGGGAAIQLQYSGSTLLMEGGTLNLTSGLAGPNGYNKGTCIYGNSSDIRIYGGTVNMNTNQGVGLNSNNGKVAIANAQVNITGTDGVNEYGLSFMRCRVPIVNSTVTLSHLGYGVYGNNASLEIINSTFSDGSSIARSLYFGPYGNNYINAATGSAVSFNGTTAFLSFTSMPNVYIKGSYTSTGGVNNYGIGTYVDPADFNSAPYAEVRSITGSAIVGTTLSANYTYWDAEGDAESGSAIKWYRCDGAAGSSGVTEIAATATYTLTSDDLGKYIYYEVSPNTATGTEDSYSQASMRIGPVSNTVVATEAPTAAATNLVLTNPSAGKVGIAFTASASATKYLIVRGSGAAPTFVPVDGTEYNAGSQTGGTIVYAGSNTSFLDTSAAAGTQYFYKVYAYNGTGTGTAYYTGQILEGSQLEKSGTSGVSATVDTDKPTALSYPDAGVRVDFPEGTNTTLTVTKNTTEPTSNFFGNLPNGRRPKSLFFTVTSSEASPGTYNIVLDFSSIVTTQTAAENFILMKRSTADATWTDISSHITNRQTDGIWGKFTVTGLTSFSQFAGCEAAAAYTVTSAADSGAGSLRNIIAAAQPGDIIQFNTGSMGGNKITLASALHIDKDITIIGADDGIILDGNNACQLITVDTGMTVRLEKLKLQNGKDVDVVGGIYNEGILYLVNSVVSGNKATGTYSSGGYTYGGVGGILQDDADTKLYIINSTIADNSGAASGEGAGGLLVSDGEVEIYNSILYSNRGEYNNVYICTTNESGKSYNSLFEDAHAYYSNALYTDNNAFKVGVNNIYGQNPSFVGSGSDPYLIYGNSPCVDTGSNVYAITTQDIRGTGYLRKLDMSNAAAGIVDMGAYEYKQGVDLYELSYTVNFNVNGGSTVNSQTIARNGKVTRPSTDPTKAEYTFGGWYTDNSFSTAFNFANTSITQTTTIYAKWTANAVNVTPTAVPTSAPAVTQTVTENTDSRTVRKVDVKGADSNGADTVATVDIVRNTADNKKVDSVVLNENKTKEILQKVTEQNQNTVQIVIDKLPTDPADEVAVTVSKDSVQELSDNKVDLEVVTDDVTLKLSKETLQAVSEKDEDLYFRVAPIRDEDTKNETIRNAITAGVVLDAAGNSTVTTLGTPMMIETNYTNVSTKLIFSLKDITIPQDKDLREQFLNSLAVYINHSDGSQELSKGTIIYDAAGNPTGVEIEISKFSTFSLISISNAAPVATDLKLTGKTAVGSKLTVAYTYCDADQDAEGKSIVKWYRADSKAGKNKVLISQGTKLTYKLTRKDQGKYILVEVAPVAKAGKLSGLAVSAAIKIPEANKIPAAKTKITTGDQKSQVTQPTIADSQGATGYKYHVKLGLFGRLTYAEKVAKLFEQKDGAGDPVIKKEGKYYRITIDFTDKAAALKACKDMKNKKHIINYRIIKN